MVWHFLVSENQHKKRNTKCSLDLDLLLLDLLKERTTERWENLKKLNYKIYKLNKERNREDKEKKEKMDKERQNKKKTEKRLKIASSNSTWENSPGTKGLWAPRQVIGGRLNDNNNNNMNVDRVFSTSGNWCSWKTLIFCILFPFEHDKTCCTCSTIMYQPIFNLKYYSVRPQRLHWGFKSSCRKLVLSSPKIDRFKAPFKTSLSAQ